MTKYEGNNNSGKPKSEYLAKIAAMTDDELEKEAERMIWLSAFANNNPRSDFHWMVDAIWDECKSRNDTTIYDRAFGAASGDTAGSRQM